MYPPFFFAGLYDIKEPEKVNKFKEFMDRLKFLIEDHSDCEVDGIRDEGCDFYEDVCRLVDEYHIT